MNTISRTAKTLDRICKFIYWLMIVSMVIVLFVLAFLGISMAVGAPLLKDNESYLLSLGNLELLLAPGVLSEILSDGWQPLLLGIVIFSIVTMPVYFLMLLTIRDVLQPFINRTPFHETVAKDLKRLSVLVVINTILNAVATGLMDHMMQNYLDLHRLFVGDQIFGDRIITVGLANTTIDLTPLLFAGALYLLSKVFLYGQELQTLSDETL